MFCQSNHISLSLAQNYLWEEGKAENKVKKITVLCLQENSAFAIVKLLIVLEETGVSCIIMEHEGFDAVLLE